MKPTAFQIDCINYVLNSIEGFSKLLVQLSVLEINLIENTGVSCIYKYTLTPNNNLTHLHFDKSEIALVGCQVNIDTLPYGATLTLWIRKGKIDTLEILTNGNDFLKNEPENYSFEIIPVNYIIDNKPKSWFAALKSFINNY